MLWWGWLGFNCGSTLGITGEKWLYASKSAVTTVLFYRRWWDDIIYLLLQ